jgi:hypothetical protein
MQYQPNDGSVWRLKEVAEETRKKKEDEAAAGGTTTRPG